MMEKGFFLSLLNRAFKDRATISKNEFFSKFSFLGHENNKLLINIFKKENWIEFDRRYGRLNKKYETIWFKNRSK